MASPDIAPNLQNQPLFVDEAMLFLGARQAMRDHHEKLREARRASLLEACGESGSGFIRPHIAQQAQDRAIQETGEFPALGKFF